MKNILFISIFAILALTATFVYQYLKFHDGRLHVVFCDVGQGDGILITTPSNKQILIDAGPDNSILDCLSRHMPFWDRSIDVVILTHPHADHLIGYYYVIDRYITKYFVTEDLKNKSDGFKRLEAILQEHNLPISYVEKGDSWKIKDGVEISIAGPRDEFIVGKNPDRFITNSAESASLITKVSYGDFTALLTGDAPIDEMREVAVDGVIDLDVLQIPHHGSSTGVDELVIDDLNPHLAVISVGKNSYGHPTAKTLGILKDRGIKVLRTDQMGDVEIVTDGR